MNNSAKVNIDERRRRYLNGTSINLYLPVSYDSYVAVIYIGVWTLELSPKLSLHMLFPEVNTNGL